MPVPDASAGVPADDEVLGLAAGDDEVGLTVAIQVGSLEVFDGDLLGRDHALHHAIRGKRRTLEGYPGWADSETRDRAGMRSNDCRPGGSKRIRNGRG